MESLGQVHMGKYKSLYETIGIRNGRKTFFAVNVVEQTEICAQRRHEIYASGGGQDKYRA